MDNGTAFALGVVSGAVIIAVLSAVCRERPVTLVKADEADEREEWRDDVHSPSDPEDWWKDGRQSPWGPAG